MLTIPSHESSGPEFYTFANDTIQTCQSGFTYNSIELPDCLFDFFYMAFATKRKAASLSITS